MNDARGSKRAVDGMQQCLTDFACALDYASLPQEAIHAAKALTIDTLGVLVAGFCHDPCRIARGLATPADDNGATIIGSRMKTTPHMAAFVNATTARYVEANDVYARYRAGCMHGHPSDVIMPLLAAAEHAHVSGRDLINAIVLAYEIYLKLCDAFHNKGFDPATFGCVAIAAAAGRLLGLTREQVAHAISMAAVANNILAQVRHDRVTMWKALAAGQAGQAGVFSAMLARAGMEGPHLPFEGKAGWCEHVARERLDLEIGIKDSTPFLILDSRIKPRPARALTIPSILAAEKLAQRFRDVTSVRRVLVEVHRQAKHGTGIEYWHPETRESADHSIPFVVAAALLYGEVTPRSFADTMLRDDNVRALMTKIEIAEDQAFTRAFEGVPQQYRARVTVTTAGGETFVAESGGDADDLAAPKGDEAIARKFRAYAEDLLGSRRTCEAIDRLWHLEAIDRTAEIPRLFVLV